MSLGKPRVLLSHLHQLLIVLVKCFDFPFRKIFDINQAIACALHRGDYLIELQMNRLRILVLRLLELQKSIEIPN